ncbi:MAG: MCE family protein [Candidatus Omnitrophica bacterium]|nr:MCE family protein [Candidatus Omnitrophota bacterium]
MKVSGAFTAARKEKQKNRRANMKVPNEIKAGSVVLIAVAIGFIFFFKTMSLTRDTYEVKTYFGYAGDLKQDAIVKLAGIEVGRVTDINFIYGADTKVECVLELDEKARIRTDSIAYIGTAGFVGDAYIGITRGKAPEFLGRQDAVKSEDPVQMRELMKKADGIAENLDDILLEVKSLVKENRPNLDSIILNLEDTTKNFKEFSEDVKSHPWKLLFKKSTD